MTRFEQLLRSDLRADRAEEPHLDADQISAFLANRNSCRESVMAHASRCPECRQVLFLASGELAPLERSGAPWRLWAWAPAAAVACVAVCAVAIGLPAFLNRGRVVHSPLPALLFPAPPPAPEPSVMVKRPVMRKSLATENALTQIPPVETFAESERSKLEVRAMQFVPSAGVKQWSVNHGMPEQSADAGNTWTQISIDPSTHFRAIGSVSNEVWAGGSAGALFHSSDLGEHWQRVKVEAGTDILASEILRLRVVTPLEIRLFVANGERWVTEDGGLTWKRE